MKCTDVRFPRQVTTSNRVSLHLFSDASSVAYGVAAYVVSDDMSTLIMAKAKVAPIKTVTIPKLELTAVLLAARFVTYIKEAQLGKLEIGQTYIWSDSQITLSWLSSTKVLPIYVRNRVDEIKALIPDATFRP